MTNFKVGQRVVCIDDSNLHLSKYSIYPQIGKVYTIRGFYGSSMGFGVSVYLEEIKNKINEYGAELSFNQRDFRPLTYASATSEILAKFPLTEEKADVEIKEHQLINNQQ